MSYSEKGGALKIWVNGRRFIARGGNWVFPESMLRYRSREYDIAVRYHREMNFTMIRNPLSDSIEVVNYSVPSRSPLTVEMLTLDPDGTVRSRNQARVVCPVDSICRCLAVAPPGDSTIVSLLRLTLRRDGKIVSENCYWRGLEQSNASGVT